jgi:uncharacterized protein YeeX (DUF496 family)
MRSKRKIRGENPDLRKLRDNQKKLMEALQVLYDLLEAYAPSWYTEEHHKLAATALSLPQ